MQLVCGRKRVKLSVRAGVCVPKGWRGPCLQPLGAPNPGCCMVVALPQASSSFQQGVVCSIVRKGSFGTVIGLLIAR